MVKLKKLEQAFLSFFYFRRNASYVSAQEMIFVMSLVDIPY